MVQQYQQAAAMPVTHEDSQRAINRDIIRFAGRTLQSGAARLPFTEFVGVFYDIDVENNNYDSSKTDVVFRFRNIRVIRVRDGAGPYPYDIADLKIKFSGSERSPFGFLVSSMDREQNIIKSESDLNRHVGLTWRLYAEDYDWGPPSAEGMQTAPDGHVHSEIWKANLLQGNEAQATVATTPVIPVASPVVPAAAPVAAPTPVSAITVTAPASSIQEAYRLINNQVKSTFYQEAMNNPAIRADGMLISAILTDTWLAGEMAAGRITLDTNGVHHVAGM
jgi:hypothetical protein